MPNKRSASLGISPTSPHRLAALEVARTQPQTRLRPTLSIQSHDGFRETTDAVAIVFAITFIVRTFIIEPFVIPTGSMAETLMGRHKDVVCEKCGTSFRVGVSDEVEKERDVLIPGMTMKHAYCSNCRYPREIVNDLPFKGDRILVLKDPFDYREPQRWEVIVFRWPMEPTVNFIKRLIGLPGETLVIHWGDIYRRDPETKELTIQRKPHDTQQSMQILVHDHDAPPRQLLERGWPECWASLKETGIADQWEEDNQGWNVDPESRAFSIDSESSQVPHWIRFRLFVPTASDWRRASQQIGDGNKLEIPAPFLVNDFYSFNSGSSNQNPIMKDHSDVVGSNWVGDLSLHAEVNVKEAAGELILELVESLRRYRCRIDLSTGAARFVYLDEKFSSGPKSTEEIPLFQAIKPTPLNRPGTHRIIFANVDDRLSLWVDGRLIKLENDGEYEFVRASEISTPTRQDLSPIGISVLNTDLEVAHLKVTRDVFYTEPKFTSSPPIKQNPEDYEPNRIHSYELGPDEFFALGDNSPKSQDSRYWEKSAYTSERWDKKYIVPRDLLIGKAFVVYWPHGIPFLNGGKGFPLLYYREPVAAAGKKQQLQSSKVPLFVFPFFPNFPRMGLIR